MTIRKGEHYVVETLDQFTNRTTFDVWDVLRALASGEHPSAEEYEPLSALNEYRRMDGHDEAASIDDLDKWEISEYLADRAVPTNQAIQATLKVDDREWVHLYNGTTHDIVELYPEADQ